MKETAERFWKAVMDRRWVKAFHECQLSWKSSYPIEFEGADQLKVMFGHLNFDDVEVIEGAGVSAVVADIIVVLRCERMILCKRNTRLIREEAVYKTSETGTWGVNPISALSSV